MRPILLLFAAPALIHPLCYGQSMPAVTPQEPAWKSICTQALQTQLPAQRPSGPLSATALATCDERALYYGLGRPADYASALQCGWYGRVHPRSDKGNMFYGPGVLTMLYANGRGVSRDYNLAIHLACENTWAAPAEMAYRIGRLEHMRDTHDTATVFDLCDDATSGLSDGACTAIQTRRADAARDQRLSALVAGLPLDAQKLFPALRTAQDAFVRSRILYEVDLSGTSRGAFQLREEAKLNDQFLMDLQRFGRGSSAAVSERELAKLEEGLNQAYGDLQHAPADQWQFGTIRPQGIQETQRTWVMLGDAWIAWAKVAYPKLSAAQVRAHLIRLRLHQLRSLRAN